MIVELAILAAFGIAALLFMMWVFAALNDWTEDDCMPPDDSHTWHQHAEHAVAVERVERADLKSITRGD